MYIFLIQTFCYRCPPDFSKVPTQVTTETAAGEDAGQFKKKTKVLAKEGSLTSQWAIMQSMGIADTDIAQFAESDYWLRYFPDFCKQDLQSIGLKVSQNLQTQFTIYTYSIFLLVRTPEGGGPSKY